MIDGQVSGRDAWVSFCISTFKRPAMLEQQIRLLLRQEHSDFYIVICDNDPDKSAEPVVVGIGDSRIRYFPNGINLGMVQSFNRAIDLAVTPYVVLVTDDDPVEPNFLSYFQGVIQQHPGLSLYGGFGRAGKAPMEKELVSADDCVMEILDPRRTTSLLWSSCILDITSVKLMKGMPDFGSPHLADHALLALTASHKGAIMINHMFSRVTFHPDNFSKLNFAAYITGCEGFYTLMTSVRRGEVEQEAISRHLGTWFISNVFNLKKYYLIKGDQGKLDEIHRFALRILSFPFMKRFKLRYQFKSVVLPVKKELGILKSAGNNSSIG